LRILPVEREAHADAAARLREALRRLAWVRHAGFAAVDDVVSVDGQVAIVSEYVEGIGLDLLLDHQRSRATPVPLRPALELVGRLAATLDAGWNRAAFEAGPAVRVLHGDVRPANVRVSEAGAIKLVDTGIALLLAEVRGRPSPFPPAYLAPERVKARGPERPADIYGLGATLLDLLTLDPLDRPRLRSDAHARLVGERAQRLAAAHQGDAALGALFADLCAFEPALRPEAAVVAERCRALAHRLSGEGFAAWAERTVPVAQAVGLSRVRAPNPLGEVLLVEDEPIDGMEGDVSDPFGLFGADLAVPPGRAEPPPPVPRPRPTTVRRKEAVAAPAIPVPAPGEAPMPVRAAAAPAELDLVDDVLLLDATGEISLPMEPEETADLTEALDAPLPAAASVWDEAPTRKDEVRALMKARQRPVDPTWADPTEAVIASHALDPTRSDPGEAREVPAWAVPERTTELPSWRRARVPSPVAPPVTAVVESTDARLADTPDADHFSAEGAVIRPGNRVGV
jgi:serine/threonine protein kinase